MTTNLTGKAAFITGASRGIGAALALGFAQAGAAVLINHKGDDARAHELVAQIHDAGGRAIALEGDIASVATCRAIAARCVDAFGRLDIACCHAGITSWGKFLDYTEDAFDEVVNVNLKGSYFCAQAAARIMAQQGTGGRIILTSSVVGNQAVPYLSAYALTKAGLQMLARNLVLELSPHQITINALAVGPIMNERNLHDDPAYAQKWGRVVPLGRAGLPQDVVGPALFLASEAASFITGTTTFIDGGWTSYSPTPDFEFVEREGRMGSG